MLVARNEQTLPRRGERTVVAGTRAVAVPADTGRREDLERVARTAVETFGGFDTWVNGAAVTLYGRLEDMPIEDQRRLFEVNYWGVVTGSLIAAGHLRPRGAAPSSTSAACSRSAR